MRKRWWAGTLLLAAVPGAAVAQGTDLYRRYCASCHGVSGAGDGPAAESLSPRPTDLRTLDLSVPELMQAIDGRRTIRAHGDATMPVWGHVLESEKTGRRHPGRTTLYEVQALAEYVRSLRAGR
jgi:mono/diheme cytochrome c family protein